MSGRLPYHVNQIILGLNMPDWDMPSEMTAMPKVLKQAGYATHMVGKWHVRGTQLFKMVLCIHVFVVSCTKDTCTKDTCTKSCVPKTMESCVPKPMEFVLNMRALCCTGRRAEPRVHARGPRVRHIHGLYGRSGGEQAHTQASLSPQRFGRYSRGGFLFLTVELLHAAVMI